MKHDIGKRGRASDQHPSAAPLDNAHQQAVLRAMLALRRSVRNGRAISLPNVRRLYLRLMPTPPSTADKHIAWLEAQYRREQPFHITDWRRMHIAARRVPAQ